MSAQLSQHSMVRLLVAEKSENAAHQIDSSLRNAGIGTRMTVSDDLVHIAQLMSQAEADLVVIGSAIGDLEQLLPRLRDAAPQTPIVVLTSTESDTGPAAGDLLALGATDAVSSDALQHLALVAQRELHHVEQQAAYQQMQQALQEAEERCNQLLQGSKAAIAYVHEGMHIHANEGYLALFGYEDVDELECVSLVDVMSPDSSDELKNHLKSLRNGTNELEFEFSGRHTDGSDVLGAMTLTNSQYEGETCLQITIRPAAALVAPAPEPVAEAVAEQHNGAAASEESDASGLADFAAAAHSAFDNDANLHYIMAAKLDHLHELHGTHGLVGTAEIGHAVWQRIRNVSAQTPATRLGDHEFLLALQAADHDAAVAAADAWRTAVSEDMLEVGEKTVRPTISVTGAQLTGSVDVDGAMTAAYHNLQELIAKNEADIVHLPALNAFDDESGGGDAKLILHQITEAIEKKGFLLLFQPVISLRGDADEHYEVFLRMNGPDGEQIQPGQFLQTAIENDVAGKIDRWVILQAIKTLSAHRAEGNTTRLTINITCNSVTDPEFPQWLSVAIKAARLPSDAIIFQITEADAITYTRQTKEFLQALRDMHCRASLSRFGLVKDPFEALEHFEVDLVKLDGTLVENVDTDPKVADALIDTVKKLQGMGKLTLVPRVENATILSTLWQAGANYIQGHYLQEPSPQMEYDFTTEE